ncbi:MAG: thiol-disulfide oxidoreductase DCC family protein [Phycisphaerales bacterium]|nr:thiol-disulfide oxidoreductase DCC family protein [Phycisphaerales bacterium]
MSLPRPIKVESVVVLYDGQCALCQWSVQFILKRDRRGRFRFAAQQSQVGQQLLAQYGGLSGPDSVVLLADGRVWVASAAALRIARELGGVWRVFGVLRLLPRPLRDWVYQWVAQHRYRWFGRREDCLWVLPEWRERFLE